MTYKFNEKRHEIYVAAAQGDVKKLEDLKSEIRDFETPAKNTIIHVYIIAQSEGQCNVRNFLMTLFQALKKLRCIETINAKEKRQATTVGDMLDLCPSLLWKVNGAEDTPLHMAARHRQAAIAKVLLDRAKSEGRDVESGTMRAREMLHKLNKGKETALHQAVRYQHSGVAQLLVDEDDPDFKYSPNENGETPLYLAAERGDYDSVEIIVKRYNSPAYEGPHGATALHAAGALRYSRACRLIVEKEELKFLTKNVDDRGRTPLHYGGVYLLKHDKSAAFIKDNDGKTALHILAGKGYGWMVRNFFLVHCPECLELEDDRGRNTLHYAVESGDKYTVEVILKSEYGGDLLKKKDKDGLTPLHLLAVNRFYMPDLIKDPRLDKMAFNAKDLTPNDIILTSSTYSMIELQLEDSMKKARIYPGNRKMANLESKLDYQTNTKTVITKPQGTDHDDLKEERQNHLVVAALIATVTFAAGFTLPGGYNQDGPDIGYAILTKQTAFQAFVIFNTLAMVLSSAAVFIHLLIAMNKKKLAEVGKEKSRTTREMIMENLEIMEKPRTKRDKMVATLKRKTEVSDLFGKALPITLIAIVAMVLAFIAGSYAVLSNDRALAVAACATGGLFFGLFWYLWKELFTLSMQLLVVGAVVLYCLLTVPILLPISLVYVSLAACLMKIKGSTNS